MKNCKISKQRKLPMGNASASQHEFLCYVLLRTYTVPALNCL